MWRTLGGPSPSSVGRVRVLKPVEFCLLMLVFAWDTDEDVPESAVTTICKSPPQLGLGTLICGRIPLFDQVTQQIVLSAKCEELTYADDIIPEAFPPGFREFSPVIRLGIRSTIEILSVVKETRDVGRAEYSRDDLAPTFVGPQRPAV